MRGDRGHALLLAAAVAGGVALGAVGSASGGACEATRRGAELLREGRPAEALEKLNAAGVAAGGCRDSALRAYNRALAHARIGRAAGDRGEAVRHLERARRGFVAALARDSAEDARWNRALVEAWLDRLARQTAREPGGGSADRSGGSGAGGRGGDTAGAGGAGAGAVAGGPESGAGGNAGADEPGAAADAGDAAAEEGTRGGGEDESAAAPRGDPTGAAALEGLLRDASASDRRLRGLILRRALVADGPEAGRW